MNLKIYKIISIIGVFLLAFPFHFLYDWFPNAIFSIFFPVNESIWEHMKLIYTSILLYEIIEYIIFKIKNIKVNNFIFASILVSIISIPIYLIIFLPIYYKIGENMFISLTIMLITIIIIQNIKFKLFSYKKLKLEIFGIILIITTYIIMGILTYYPQHFNLFFDPLNEIYGINIQKK